MSWKNNIQAELKQLVTLKDTNRKWQFALLTAICVGAPLVIGLYFDNIGAGLIASLSGMVILYLPDTGSLTNKISTLLISSFGFMVSFAVGQFFSFNHIVSVIAFGIYAMTIHWVILYYKTAPPRSFFFIFIAAISICQPFNLAAIPTKIGLISLGLMFSSFLALGHLVYLSTKVNWEVYPKPQSIFTKNTYADFWEAIIMGVFMAVSLACGYLFEMDNPYWIPVSCAAVMQGASRYHIWQRTFHRILGTFLGLGLCWALLSVTHSIIVLCIFIILLQLIVELLVVRNYAIAVIFITPLAIFLSEAASPIIDTPNVLIVLRFQEIVIGSAIGAVGGWVLHKEKIRYATISGLKKISGGLENKDN
ncbi:FUSC family protein [uncultured Draconibacterium sp.]|uniref:FUSC family protein n=1 Tax=uncultured Draconibacterium sp. TaxID=1573823 RepID=UPI0025D9EBF4|nr:FUSC family protein [uncultured Draconibacterium sp.]